MTWREWERMLVAVFLGAAVFVLVVVLLSGVAW
jgi:hypothetical protein